MGYYNIIGGFDDFIDVVNGFWFFDFGDDFCWVVDGFDVFVQVFYIFS